MLELNSPINLRDNLIIQDDCAKMTKLIDQLRKYVKQLVSENELHLLIGGFETRRRNQMLKKVEISIYIETQVASMDHACEMK
jgi:hypothetical protein